MNSKQFGQWIKEIRAAHISREKFSAKYGWHVNTLKSYENKGRLPDLEYLFSLAVETSFDFFELVRQRLLAAQEDKDIFTDIDVIEVCESHSPYVLSSPQSGISQYTHDSDNMFPVINKGALISYDTSQNQLQDGKMFVFKFNDLLQVRRIQIMNHGGVMLICDNNAYSSQELNKTESEELQIVGMVTAVTNYY